MADTSTTANNNATNSTADNADTGAALKSAAQPYLDKAKGFAKARPMAAAAVVGLVGLGLLNSLRGRGART